VREPEFEVCEHCGYEYEVSEGCLNCSFELSEPDHNDEVLCCPDCERPNQFGELCMACQRERDADQQAQDYEDATEPRDVRCVW